MNQKDLLFEVLLKSGIIPDNYDTHDGQPTEENTGLEDNSLSPEEGSTMEEELEEDNSMISEENKDMNQKDLLFEVLLKSGIIPDNYDTHDGQLTEENTGLEDNSMSPEEGSTMEEELEDDNSMITEEESTMDEELKFTEEYVNYRPSNMKINISPDLFVEETGLACVTFPIKWYNVSLPHKVIVNAEINLMELEAVTYACQQHANCAPNGKRSGFLIGDGAGMRKGRILAGIIYENYLLGRKRSIWVCDSNDLKWDVERNLKNIGATKIKVHSLNKFHYDKISSKVNGSVKKGVIFATYSSLIGESQSGGKYQSRLKQLLHWCGEDYDGCIVFDECHKAKTLCPTGSSILSKTSWIVLELQNKLPKARIVYSSATCLSEPKNMACMTRLGLWGEGNYFKDYTDFLYVFGNLGVGAMKLLAMDMKLQGFYIARQLSFIGVTFKIVEFPLEKEFKDIYKNFVGLWVKAGSMFREAANLIECHPRTKTTMWNQFWSSHQRFFKILNLSSKVKHVAQLAREYLNSGFCVVISIPSTGEARTQGESGGEITDFVPYTSGVLRYLIENHFPAPDHKKTTKVIGMNLKAESKTEASTSSGGKRKSRRSSRQGVKRHREYKLSDISSKDNVLSGGSDFASTDDEDDPASESDDLNAGSVSDSEQENDNFNPFIKRDSDSNGPWKYRKKSKKEKGKKRKNKGNHCSRKNNVPSKPNTPVDSAGIASAMKAELLEKIENFGYHLPQNPLDQLINDLGGLENVAEMTGRKGRVISNDGTIQYESRSEADAPLETLNMVEKQRFMDGEKHIAIISEAASLSICLQSDRRVKNQNRRVHMILELPWSPDEALQQLSRTHRSNQVNAPEYLFLISDLANEQRCAAIVATRLQSLGAVTYGDRRAKKNRDLSHFEIDTKYGRTALKTAMRAVMEYEVPLVPPPADYKGNFFCDVRRALIGVSMITEDPSGYLILEKDYNNMSKFMDRILGLPVELQNGFFQYFTDTLDAVIAQAKKVGRYELGILDLGTGGDTVKRVKLNSFLQKHATGTAKTELHTVLVDRGLKWDEALGKLTECSDKDEGFYLSAQARNSRKTAILTVADTTGSKSGKGKLFRVYRPNTGLQAKQETLDELKSKYQKSATKDVEQHWKENYEASATLCSHMYLYGQCRRKAMGVLCEVGLRQRQYYVLSGSVLAVWGKIGTIMTQHHGNNHVKLQAVRLKIDETSKIVGCIIPGNVVEILKTELAKDAADVEEQEF